MSEQLHFLFDGCSMFTEAQKTGAFYNTTKLKGQNLSKAKAKVENQDSIVLEFFKRNRNDSFTPCEVHSKVLRFAPITSVRRAITNLTNEGLLEKTDEQRNGEYGMPNYCWKYNSR